ncbi:MAG: DUF4276 family protein [Cyanobacteria bacterium J06600_6]
MSNYDQLFFLLEERSMHETLKILLPRIIPDHIYYKCIPHEGKHDLEKSIPRKLRAFPKSTKFVVVRDKDSGDCIAVKQKLVDLCKQANRSDTLIRIACHELESWFLGDLKAVEQGLELNKGKLSKLQNKAKYRNPDRLASPKQELQRIAPDYQQIRGSRAIATYLDLRNNASESFQVFVKGIQQLVEEW